MKATCSSYCFVFSFLTRIECQCSRHCTEHWIRHNSLFTWLTDKMGRTQYTKRQWRGTGCMHDCECACLGGRNNPMICYLEAITIGDENRALISPGLIISKSVYNYRILMSTLAGCDSGSAVALLKKISGPPSWKPGFGLAMCIFRMFPWWLCCEAPIGGSHCHRELNVFLIDGLFVFDYLLWHP